MPRTPASRGSESASRWIRGLTRIVPLFATFIVSGVGETAEGVVHERGAHADAHDHMMGATLGPYPKSREASGTSWQPESTPHPGLHFEWAGWSAMAHATSHGVYTHQGGDRGDDDVYGANMFMLMAQRPAPGGRIGLRTMLSLEPATIGKEGYPLLLQTGETADGETPLVDRQHPHDLFMELAATYSVDFAGDGSVFAYVGLPGEPAIGPPTFMHRFSAVENPEAPISHHWLDSTHISFGVVTAGVIKGPFKIDGSIFNGHEPDEDRYDIETEALESWAIRGSWNPLPDLAVQGSFAALDSPEQLHPGTDTDRVTVSIIHNTTLPAPLGGGTWQTLFAWGRNMNEDPPSEDHSLAGLERNLDAFLAESAVSFFERHTAFGRIERVENGELFPESSPFHARRFTVGKLSLGYVYDFLDAESLVAGIGAVGSVALLRGEPLRSAYGDAPLSGSFFIRLKVG